MLPLILASASPQRKTLLEGLGLEFSVVPSAYDESQCTEADPGQRALLLAESKARVVAEQHPEAIIIGCDTLVVAHDGTLLEKPVDRADAKRMLELHSGSTSIVHSGLCVLAPDDQCVTALSSTQVHFKTLTPENIDWWLGTTLWLNRSGGFQIDGLGQLMIERIEGDWTGVVGLPVCATGELLSKVGVQVM